MTQAFIACLSAYGIGCTLLTIWQTYLIRHVNHNLKVERTRSAMLESLLKRRDRRGSVQRDERGRFA